MPTSDKPPIRHSQSTEYCDDSAKSTQLRLTGLRALLLQPQLTYAAQNVAVFRCMHTLHVLVLLNHTMYCSTDVKVSRGPSLGMQLAAEAAVKPNVLCSCAYHQHEVFLADFAESLLHRCRCQISVWRQTPLLASAGCDVPCPNAPYAPEGQSASRVRRPVRCFTTLRISTSLGRWRAQSNYYSCKVPARRLCAFTRVSTA